jgi:hypothetical protein
LPERFGIAAVGYAIPLRDQPGRTGAVSHKDGQSCKALVANKADLDTFSVRLNGEDGDHSGVEKVARLDGFSGFINNLVKLKAD